MARSDVAPARRLRCGLTGISRAAVADCRRHATAIDAATLGSRVLRDAANSIIRCDLRSRFSRVQAIDLIP
jgi:hypothetical protein